MADAFIDPVPAQAVLAGPEIHPGFGRVALCRNGVEVAHDVTGEHDLDWYDRKVRQQSTPHQTPVWTLHIDAPFESTVYALTDAKTWTLLDRKPGFA